MLSDCGITLCTCSRKLQLQMIAREQQRLLTFVVGGGGFSGVECIAEMHDFLSYAIRAYPSLNPKDLRTIILQSARSYSS